MPADNGNLPHTAITIWNGFNYQGKVALCHVISLLSLNPEACKHLTLQLDSWEDFAIFSEETPVSLHQVKALKSQNFSAYSTSLDQLKQKSSTAECDDAFFHMAKQVTNKSVNEIEEEFAPVRLYKYKDDKRYCNLHEIDARIQHFIKEYYHNNHEGDMWRLTDEYLTKTKNYLEQVVINQIMYIHNLIHNSEQTNREAAYTQRINFNKFLEILKSDLSAQTLGDEYFLFTLQRDLNGYCQNYCFELEEEAEIRNKLRRYIGILNNLSSKEMVRFVRNIVPHREVKFETISDYKDFTINKEDMQDAFLKILHELKEADFEDQKKYFFWQNNSSNNYIPTSIKDGQSHHNGICNKIIKNALKTDLDVMFEKNKLITTDMEVSSILDSANNISEIKTDDEKAKRITRWKNVSLIKLANAKVEIND